MLKNAEKVLKSLKCQYASSRHNAPPPSLLVARGDLDAKTEELEVAKAAFARQRRAPLLNLARNKTRRGRKQFWSFVSRKCKKAGDLPTLQDVDTGRIRHEPVEISEGVYQYLRVIFSGSDVDLSSVQESEDEQECGVEAGLDDVGAQGFLGLSLIHI